MFWKGQKMVTRDVNMNKFHLSMKCYISKSKRFKIIVRNTVTTLKKNKIKTFPWISLWIFLKKKREMKR